MYRVESGDVRGLAVAPKEGIHRQGELVFEDPTGSSHTFKILADHTYLIPDGSYTLLGSNRWYTNWVYWVVGRLRDDGKFEKLSVFRSLNDEEVRLGKLGLKMVGVSLC